jgi:hypothetical protein
MAPNSYKQTQFDNGLPIEMKENAQNGDHPKTADQPEEVVKHGEEEKGEAGGGKKKDSGPPPVGVRELFKYADRLDTVLVIGTIRKPDFMN